MNSLTWNDNPIAIRAVTVCVNRAQSLEANGQYLAGCEARKCAAALAEEFGVAPLVAEVPPGPPVLAQWWE